MSERFDPTRLVQEAKRWVVKVGTSVLTDSSQTKVSPHCVHAVAEEIAALWKAGKEVVLVTSGAIGVGMGILDLKKRPEELAVLQAAAATGQGKLMQWYSNQFEKEGLHCAQLLLTREDIENPQRYQNAKATLSRLLKAGVVPVINENDSVSTEEIRYGDNDILSAYVAGLVKADLLVLLSDVDRIEGFPTVVTEITADLEKAARGTDKAVSTGGMKTKLAAAKFSTECGICVAIANGRRPNALSRMVLNAEMEGITWFPRKK